MNHASLFSGIGGFDLAAEWMGWTNIFNCDIEEFPRKVLKYHFPNATQYADIKQTDFTIHAGQIDILTGGFPCQPFSMAGKRLGKNDERHLWPEMYRAIREINPKWIVGENVRGLLNWSDGLVLDEVYTDLGNEGYEIESFVLPAVGINAPHKRDRVWIIASNTERISRKTEKGIYSQRKSIKSKFINQSDTRNVANTKGIRSGNGKSENNHSGEWIMEEGFTSDRNEIRSCIEGYSNTSTHTNNNGQTPTESRKKRFNSWGNNEARKNWFDFPTQSPICGGDDGFPGELDDITISRWRTESIKAYGNAIVPQIAYRIFQAIEFVELDTYK